MGPTELFTGTNRTVHRASRAMCRVSRPVARLISHKTHKAQTGDSIAVMLISS